MHQLFHGRLKVSPVPPASRSWLCTCCLVLLRVCRKPKRCPGFCRHPVPAVRPASVSAMHPEVPVLGCSTTCSSHFSSVSGAIYWWKNIPRKKPMDFARMHKALPLRCVSVRSLCSSSTSSKPQGWFLACKEDLTSCP